MRASFFLVCLLAAAPAASKPKLAGEPKPLAEIEAQLKQLTAPSKKEAAERFDSLTKWLGIGLHTCPEDACKTIVATKIVSANLDSDSDDEKVLSITTRGAGACAPVHLTAIVLDSTPSGWVASGKADLAVSAAPATPTADVSAANVHSSKVKDLVLRVDGQCAGGTREQKLSVQSFETGKLVELMATEDSVGTTLSSHAFSGDPPVAIELTHPKGKTKLSFVEAAFGYDALPSYDEASKKSVSKDDDLMLSSTDCAAPLGGSLALDCNLNGTAKVQVFVQQGKAIGLTVTSDPPKPSFVRCMRQRVIASTWKAVPGPTGCTRSYKVM